MLKSMLRLSDKVSTTRVRMVKDWSHATNNSKAQTDDWLRFHMFSHSLCRRLAKVLGSADYPRIYWKHLCNFSQNLTKYRSVSLKYLKMVAMSSN